MIFFSMGIAPPFYWTAPSALLVEDYYCNI